MFLSIILVMTPPAVSKPIDNGATSKSKISLQTSPPPPVKIAAYTAAP